MFSVALCISVSGGARVLRHGKIVHVSGDCSLREVLQEVGFGDRVNDVPSARKLRPQTFSPNKTLSYPR